jgi:branched-chain amino acid transport system permease protein
MSQVLEIVVAGVLTGTVYGVIAMGFVLINKATGVLNIAHGALVTLGAFLAYSTSKLTGLPFPVAVPLALGAAFLLGAAAETAFLRPLIGRPVLAAVMMTFALLSIVQGVVITIWGTEYYNYPRVLPEAPIRIGEIVLSYELVGGAVVSVVLMLLLAMFFKLTRIGIQMRAVADDAAAAQAAGISARRISSLAWALGTGLAAVGGVILGLMSMVFYGLDVYGLKVLPVVILGGLESLPGALLGGIIIGVLESVSEAYLGSALKGIKEVAPFVALILILLVRPYGLFGERRIERV